MGMDCTLVAVSDAEANALRESPDLAEALLDRVMDASDELADDPAIGPGGEAEVPDTWVELETMWGGVHWLLTDGENALARRSVHPLGFLVGGAEVRGSDPACSILVPNRVHEIAGALDELSDAMLRERFDPIAMREAGVYRSVSSRDPASSCDDLVLLVGWLRGLFRSARRRGDAVVVMMT